MGFCVAYQKQRQAMHLRYIYPFKVLKPRNKSMIIAHKSLAMDCIVNSV